MNKLLIPNTTQIPNVVLDDLMPRLSGSEFKVLLAIVRKTYGWQKRSDKISFTTLRQLTGLSRDAVNQAIKALGPLLTITPGRKGVPTLEGINEYALNFDVETGQLLVRKSDQSENNTSQKTSPLPVRKSDSSKPKYSKPTKRARAKNTRPKEPNPTINDLKAFWASEYQKLFGVAYSFNHKIDGAHFKELLASFDAALIKDRIVKFFDLDDEWIQTIGGYTVGVFRKRINTLNSIGRRTGFTQQQELPA